MIVKSFVVFFFILLFTFLPSYVNAAKPSLELKIHKLNEAARKNQGVVEIDSGLYDEFTAKPRNYSIAILLTALDPAFKCTPCREFDPEFRLVARSWLESGSDTSRLYFGLLDYINGREIYNRLNLNNAPTLIYFPPTTGQYAKEFSEDRYDFNRNGFSAESFASYLSHQLGTQVPVNRPFNYFAISMSIFSVVAVLAILKLMYPMILSVVQNKNIWTTFSLIIILLMISGHMWNHIRSPPYVIAQQNGKIGYVAPGFSSQIVIESQIVFIIYGICALSVISLITSVPKIEDKIKQRFGVYIWMGILVAIFSLLFALFRIKNPGYPFRLFI